MSLAIAISAVCDQMITRIVIMMLAMFCLSNARIVIKEFLGCCSKDCMNFSKLSDDKQKQFRKDPDKVVYKKRYSMRALNSN